MKLKLIKDTPLHDDLVNNYELFHEKHTDTKLANLPEWEDDSDYSNFEHIDDFLIRAASFTEEEKFGKDNKEKMHVVRMPVSYAWSSEESKDGCDRPKWVAEVADNEKNLNEKVNVKGHLRKKGFSSTDAAILSGYIRYSDGEPDIIQIVKYIGNNRLWMKLLANRGVDTDVVISLKFHKPDLSVEEMMKVEAEAHTTEHQNSYGQNEKQKFVSMTKAEKKVAMECYNFLKTMELNYGGIMERDSEVGKVAGDWLTLTSLQGIKNGASNQYFSKYGRENVKAAVKTIQQIAKEITGETVIGSTPLQSFSMMYYSFTEHGKMKNSKEMMMTKVELHDYFIKLYKANNAGDDMFAPRKMLLSDLSQSNGVKDVVFICAKTFWPTLPMYWKSINNTTNGFSLDCQAVIKFVSFSKDRFLKNEIKSMVA